VPGGRGSRIGESARLVQLDYRPEGTARPGGAGRGSRPAARGGAGRPIVLIGKGITYDTGGISIKPREAMVPMKTDMSGAGAVLSVLAACRAAGSAAR